MNKEFPLVARLEDLIQEALIKNNLRDVVVFSSLYRDWELVVGELLYKKTVPYSVSKKTLNVLVADSTYSHQLQYCKGTILGFIEGLCGENVIRRIQFRVGDIPEKRKMIPLPPRFVPKKILPDEQSIEKSKTCASQIKDQRLQRAFQGMMAKRITKVK